MKYKTVIWDFNGTILDDTKISIDAINTVLQRRNMKTVDSLADFQEVFCFPVSEYYRRLGFDFEKEPYKIPADEWVELYTAKMEEAVLYPNIKETLTKIKKAGIHQIVLSACETNRLTSQINSFGIEEYFDRIIGTGDVYAKGKEDLAKDLSKESDSLFPAVFIGDTDHDHRCAKIIGCDCILFSGGFMSHRRLNKFSCPIIDRIEKLSEMII